jgi:hypothetical protein
LDKKYITCRFFKLSFDHIKKQTQSQEEVMKYLCLVYGAENLMQTMDDNECAAYGNGLKQKGRHIAAEALQPVETATTVRVRNGQVSITDGPFAETKEQLAGFYLIDAQNLDEAIRIASGIPPARIGSIEIRPVRELNVT